MQKFVIRLLRFSLLGIFPFILYLYDDPFKVIFNYSDYSNSYVIPNRDYISTEQFIKNKNNYNSFIFGDSRTLGFKPSTWKHYLQKNDKPFMFDASAETIYGIYIKIKYLDSIHAKINNVLIIVCRDNTFCNYRNDEGHLFIKHPETTKQSKVFFHYVFLKAYLSPKFLFSLYSYKLFGKYQPYMKDYIENRKITFDKVTNQLTLIDKENEIRQHPLNYYIKRKDIFYKRECETIDSVKRINKKHLFMLKEIKRILVKNRTHYKVILSPLYDQVKFNPSDFSTLKSIFSNNLYDFTGKNLFTEKETNYYETSHFRPLVGDSILKIIY